MYQTTLTIIVSNITVAGYCATNYAPPMRLGCTSTWECQSVQSDSACQQLTNGQTGCCPQMHYVQYVTPAMDGTGTVV